MAWYGAFTRRGASGFGWSSTADEVMAGHDLTGTHWLLTGCTSGIGRATLEAMTGAGATVWGTSRDAERATAAGARGLRCELTEPEQIDAVITQLRQGPRLDGIIANAGIFLSDAVQVEGREAQLMANHVGHAKLILGLLDHLTPEARILMVASDAHRVVRSAEVFRTAWDEPASGIVAYGVSKLANVLFAQELSRRLPPGQRAIALHPGSVQTGIARNLAPWLQRGMDLIAPIFLKSPEQGAATTVFGVVRPEAVNGCWLVDANLGTPSPVALDSELAAWLWRETEALIADW